MSIHESNRYPRRTLTIYVHEHCDDEGDAGASRRRHRCSRHHWLIRSMDSLCCYRPAPRISNPPAWILRVEDRDETTLPWSFTSLALGHLAFVLKPVRDNGVRHTIAFIEQFIRAIDTRSSLVTLTRDVLATTRIWIWVVDKGLFENLSHDAGDLARSSLRRQSDLHRDVRVGM